MPSGDAQSGVCPERPGSGEGTGPRPQGRFRMARGLKMIEEVFLNRCMSMNGRREIYNCNSKTNDIDNMLLYILVD